MGVNQGEGHVIQEEGYFMGVRLYNGMRYNLQEVIKGYRDYLRG